MPDRIVFIVSSGVFGAVAALISSLFRGRTVRHSVLLAVIALLYCAALCTIAIEVWPEWPVMVAACVGLLGFSPELVLKRLEIGATLLGAAGKAAKKLFD